MSDQERAYPDAVRSLTQAARAVAKAERERDEAWAERDRAVDQANNIAAEWIVTERERDEARAVVARVRALHVDNPEYIGWLGAFCIVCNRRMPCDTIRSLDGESQS